VNQKNDVEDTQLAAASRQCDEVILSQLQLFRIGSEDAECRSLAADAIFNDCEFKGVVSVTLCVKILAVRFVC